MWFLLTCVWLGVWVWFRLWFVLFAAVSRPLLCPSRCPPCFAQTLFVIKLLKSGKQPRVFQQFFTQAWLPYAPNQTNKHQIQECYTSVPDDIGTESCYKAFTHRIQDHIEDWQDGSAWKGTCCQCDNLSLIPWTHVVDGRN